MMQKPLLPIILLNWNGASDTVECLASLFRSSYSAFFVVVVDNGSADGSLHHIEQWLQSSERKYLSFSEGDVLTSEPEEGGCYLLGLQQNYGFSIGNNKGIAFLAPYHYQQVLLLNNDTEVATDFLQLMISFMTNHPEYKAATPLIMYHGEPGRIWNAGGKIGFGLRKYFFAGELLSAQSLPQWINISFVTGCALMADRSLIQGNAIFTERFFFGEEDFEFSLRMKRNGIGMACVTNAVIYHKVSASTASVVHEGKVYLYYLNRFINMKHHYNNLQFWLWKMVYVGYIAFLLKKLGYSAGSIIRFILRLLNESKRYNGVDKQLFNQITKLG